MNIFQLPGAAAMVVKKTPPAFRWCLAIGALFAFWGYVGMVSYSPAQSLLWNLRVQQVEAGFLPTPDTIACLSARFQNVFNRILGAEEIADICPRVFIQGQYVFGLAGLFFLFAIYFYFRKEQLPNTAPIDLGPLTEEQKQRLEERRQQIAANLEADKRPSSARDIGN